MSPFLLSLLIAVTVSIWIYSRFFSRRTGGGNAKPAIIGSAVVGVVLFIILFFTLSSVLSK